MKKIFVILICTLVLAIPVLSATEISNNNKVIENLNQPPVQWQNDYGYPEAGCAYFVQQTGDGGYIATGVITTTGGSNHEAYLVKTDANGNAAWSQIYGGATVFDCAYCVQQTTDGGYIMAGCYHGWGLWLIKTDASGNQQWSQVFNGPMVDSAYSVIQTTDGGYAIVGGYTYAPGPPDMWIIKTDSNGNQQWDRKTGGGSSEYGYCIRQTTDGGYIIAGYTDSFGAGQEDARLVKLDSGGNIAWIQNYGGTNDDRGHSVRQTSDGGFIMAGFTKSSGAGQADVYLIKTDNSGNLVWSQTYGGNSDDIGNSVRQTTDGGYIIFGTTDSYGAGGTDAYLIKTDSSGVKQWESTYGTSGNDDGQCVQQTSDGYYILAGAKNIHTTYTQFWLIKLGISTNQPPSIPTIMGTVNGKAGTSYPYTVTSTDPDGDQVFYYINWGDTTNTGWFGPFTSGVGQTQSHSWSSQSTFIIQAKAKDTNGAESGWGKLTVTMPRNKAMNSPLSTLLQKYPRIIPIIQQLLQRLGL